MRIRTSFHLHRFRLARRLSLPGSFADFADHIDRVAASGGSQIKS
jgi:hypothetical protein